MSDDPDHWSQTKLALTLLAIDPKGLGGIWLRARVGPVRDKFIAALGPSMGLGVKRLHPGVTDDQLYGGLDLTATLETGTTVLTDGLLNAEPTCLMLTMAERAEAGLTARIAQVLDERHGHSLIALDEGIEDEALSENLRDRLAFHLDFQALRSANCPEIHLDLDRIEIARHALQKITLDHKYIADVSAAALSYGIFSLRAPLFVIRAARALAAIQRAKAVEPSHLMSAMSLIMGPRATMLPPEDAREEDLSQSDEQDGETSTKSQDVTPPLDMMLDAVRANLPDGLLESLANMKAARQATGSGGSGDVKKGNRRGRPKPSRRGRLGSASRVDLIATLRAAAPWQTIRNQAKFAPKRAVHLRASDLRLKQFEEKSDRLLIFAVDASGSSALARLAEAKGAVELLLAEAYARRDHVALIAFRGTRADVLLPPTRSLVQTKRRLAALPGGGGTPLASGLQAALTLAESTRSKGLTPTIAILSDGRANIALDGSADRITAAKDARDIARLVTARQTAALVIDTGNRPQKALQELALDLNAPYLPLPRADAQRVSEAIGAMIA